jgi:hypothetical protein
MFLREMISESVDEGATPIFGKTGNKVVRKFRCTSGSRKGRIKANRTKRTSPASQKLTRLNVGSRRRLVRRKRRGSNR